VVYVDPSCPWCQRALGKVLDCPALLERVRVEVRDIDTVPSSELFGAVPAFAFRGRLVHLGTPDCGALLRVIEALLPGDEGDGTCDRPRGVEFGEEGRG